MPFHALCPGCRPPECREECSKAHVLPRPCVVCGTPFVGACTVVDTALLLAGDFPELGIPTRTIDEDEDVHDLNGGGR